MPIGCVICTEEFSAWQLSDKVSVVIKCCGHVFHECCLKLWLKNSRTCPVCRQTTFDSPSYIGRVHLQRLSLDNTSVNNILDESLEQKKKLEELELKLKKKELELKLKENQCKELYAKLNVVRGHLKKIDEDLKNSLHNPIVEIQDDDDADDNDVLVISSREPAIQPRPSITRTVRVPISGTLASRFTRPVTVSSRTITRVASRGRVVQASCGINSSKQN